MGTLLFVGTGIMTGAGWWCQLWRYPSFRTWPTAEFCRLHQNHTLGISFVVIPGMIAQMCGITLLWQQADAPVAVKILHVGLGLASIGPTLAVSGPIHGRLAKGKSDQLIEKLIRTNLPRTLVWSAQCVASLFLLG